MSRCALLPVSRISLAGALFLAAACGSDETAPVEDHTPASYNLIVNDVPQTSPYVLTAGETSRIQIKIFNAAGDDLHKIEAEHLCGPALNPTPPASAPPSAH